MAGHRADVGERRARPRGERERDVEEDLAGDHERVAVGQPVHRGRHRTLDGVLQRHQRGVGVTRSNGGQGGRNTRLGVSGSLRGGNCADERCFGEGTLGPEIGEPRRRRTGWRPGHPTRVVRAGGGRCPTRGKLPRNRQIPARGAGRRASGGMRGPPPGTLAPGDLSAVLWQLLAASAREDATAFLALLADADRRAGREHRPALGRLAARPVRPPGPDRERPGRRRHGRRRRPRGAREVPAVGRHRPAAWRSWRTARCWPTTSTPPCCWPSTPACSPRAPRPPSPRGRCCRRTAGCPSPCPASTWRSRRSRRRCAGSTSPRRCGSPPTSGGCGCCRPSSTPSWRRRCAAAATSTAPANSRWRRSPAPSRPARSTGSPSRTRPTCSTSSRRGR